MIVDVVVVSQKLYFSGMDHLMDQPTNKSVTDTSKNRKPIHPAFCKREKYLCQQGETVSVTTVKSRPCGLGK